MFVDEALLTIRSGKGGPGSLSFLREANNPRGGPDGGDGGKGGDVWIVADAQKNTLVDFRHVHNMAAEKGQSGGARNCTGRSGEDLVVHVPPGTLVYDSDKEELLADLDHRGARYKALSGGRGGRGNARFVSSTNRSPRYAQPGEPGAELAIRLELKLLADVGIIGFPSVGKSTLISTISSSRPKIAAYPFTTLTPNLGVVERFKGFPFVVADVPGLIEGAHEGKGLGHHFLKHIQRTSLLVHVLDAQRTDLLADYHALRHELIAFDESLALRTEIVAINKVDALWPEAEEQVLRVEEFLAREAVPHLRISAATGEGIERLLNGVARALRRDREAEAAESE